MKILLTGASGLIGTALSRSLGADGHSITALTRGRRKESEPCWTPEQREIHLGPATGLDAVIHLAGETVAQRWTGSARRRIYDSRVSGTRLLCDALAKLPTPPKVLLCASATGIYGDRDNEILTEASAPGEGFLAKVVKDWEAATGAAAVAGIRVVHLRFGIVLHPSGGALAKMLPTFRLGLGGKLGSGRQYWSWVMLEDAVSAIRHCLASDQLAGAVNIVAPNAVTNAEFTNTLARALHRPAWFAVPKFALKVALGEMAEETMFVSFRVQPARLTDSGFTFRYPELRPALEALLKNPKRSARSNIRT